MILIKKVLYLLILFFLPLQNLILAQQGKVDTSFNTIDNGEFGDGFNNAVRTLQIQRDGNLIVGGDYISLNGIPVSYLTRLNPDGSIDESFNTGTGFNGKIYSSYLQPDGKIIIGGSFTAYNGISAGRIIRLNPDGSYDSSFNTSTGATTGIIYDIALQSDGKIIMVGSFTKYNSVTVNRIARLLPNGALDSSFLTNNGSALNITHVKILPSEKIVLTGNFTVFNGTPANRIIRLNNNGSYDSSFNSGAGFDDDVNAIALQTNGKIVLGGNFTSYNSNVVNRIIRLNEDGTKDESFLTGSGFSKEGVEVIKISQSGDIMIGGSFTGFYNNSPVNRLTYLNSDGTQKADFDIGSGPASASVLALETDEENSWYAGGSFAVFNGQNQGRLVKMSNDGEADTAYLSSGIGFDNSVLTILPLPNKKTIIGGNFKKFNKVLVSKITCLLEDGAIDTAFNAENVGANNLVKTAVLQEDQKIIIGGSFTKYNDIVNNRIVRIFQDGQIDNSFYCGEGFNGQVYALAIQSDQKIIVAGAFSKYIGSAINANKIVRLLADGSKDSSFNIGLGADGIIESVVVQTDGKILVGGHFKTFNGLPFAGLVRLNSDGTIDLSFKIREGFDKYVYAIALQSDQKIIVGGSFLTFDGISQKRILRLNIDGSLDTTFDSGTGFSKGDVRTILIQPDDRILVGGAFSGTYKNVSAMRLIRLLPSGSFDDSFAVSLNNTLFAMNFTVDYRLLIGGIFNSVSGISKHRIARLKLCVNTTIWNGNSWSAGFPSAGKDVYFNENYPNLTSANICACSVAQDKIVTLLEKNSLNIEFAYTGFGTLILENAASLYQSDDDMVNTGIIHLKRKTNPAIRFDVTYWSSPVAGQKMFDFSPDTLLDKYYWYDPISSWNVSLYGTMTMNPGQGYSIRAPQYYSTTERSIFEGIFKGVPNNGKINVELPFANKSYLIGNPYPSAIDADSFIKSNLPTIKTSLCFWTHNTPPINNYYSRDDFAVYNLLGGVGTSSAESSGANTSAPDGTIASGQAFFLRTNSAGTLEFNDSMRILGSNSSFFKPSKSEASESKIEKHRFWLNLKSQDGIFKQILLGYADGASNDLDAIYDAESLDSNPLMDFYSKIDSKKLVIQGRELPFTENDSIVLGYKLANKNSLILEIDHQDSFFNGKSIFLWDKVLHKLHNLSETSYQFESESGITDDRFTIVFTDKKLDRNVYVKSIEEVLVSVKKHIISIESSNENLKEVCIYDVLGNQLYKKDRIETKRIFIENLGVTNQVLFVKITLENGNVSSRKIIL
ncbi:putative delta-60 repeat protein [Flavobacterium nitrogenifigens]|uniref:Delta-60 repeat protein n=2 Tax=Flavobacterium TaxID=237 RepID=A0ABR6Q7M0_9FLAO|nr:MULTISPECIES: T9SS sorting signal type C domain-containing protein [Flavobacterium]MBB4801040.1 putative delta-60 repeat protein [Flavobacterium nitrogenifigens]MBB6385212.1 putative delta-60 repeat protein [Flavobacterium notoginsengisoli]